MSKTRTFTRKLLEGDREKATTNEMRYDWLADRWVIIAPQRTSRPDDYIRKPDKIQDSSVCPFCFGKESQTPDALETYSLNPDRGWDVRVVPNKFPAVHTPINGFATADFAADVSEESHYQAEGEERIDLFQRRRPLGGHEVIIESPNHVHSITELDKASTELVFRSYRDRLKYWLSERKCQYAVVFKNVGQDAGASLAHAHSQLIATDVVPSRVRHGVERMKLFQEKRGECMFCSMIADEIEQEVRIVETTQDFVAFCPFASRSPSLISVIPRRHSPQFELLDDFELEQLSWLTHRLVRRLEKCHPDSAYNFVIHTAPGNCDAPTAVHWRLELFPRITKTAGFEWGSDCFINPLPPEDSADQLRRAGV